MQDGLGEAEIARLDDPDATFTSRERLALELAERLALDPASLDDEVFARLRCELTDPEILELAMMAGQYLGFGRLIRALDLESPRPPAE